MVKGTIPTATDRGKGKNSKPGPLSAADLERELWRVLKHLDDPYELDESRLTHLKGIDVLAQRHHQYSTFAKGEVIKEVLTSSLERLPRNKETRTKLSRCCCLLREVAGGSTLVDASRRLGLRREYVSREYRPRAVRILAKEFTAELERRLRGSHSPNS